MFRGGQAFGRDRQETSRGGKASQVQGVRGTRREPPRRRPFGPQESGGRGGRPAEGTREVDSHLRLRLGRVGLKARNVADLVIQPQEIEEYATNKRKARGLAQACDFFIAEA